MICIKYIKNRKKILDLDFVKTFFCDFQFSRWGSNSIKILFFLFIKIFKLKFKGQSYKTRWKSWEKFLWSGKERRKFRIRDFLDVRWSFPRLDFDITTTKLCKLCFVFIFLEERNCLQHKFFVGNFSMYLSVYVDISDSLFYSCFWVSLVVYIKL